MDSWVQASSRKWDVISFQFGLHDLGYDTERISVEQYSALLTNITAKLVAGALRISSSVAASPLLT